MHSYNTFGAWTSHEQTRTQKTHHNLDLGEATTFPLIVLCLATGLAFKCHFVLGLPNGTSMTLNAHNFVFRLPIEVRFETKL